MTTKVIKQVNVDEEIKKCTDSKGETFKIPVFKSISCIEGVLVGELEGYTDVPDHIEEMPFDEPIFH